MPSWSAGGDEAWGGAAGRGAEPGDAGRSAVLHACGAGLLAGRRLGSAGEEGWGRTVGPSWSGASDAMCLCRAGGEGGKMGDGWLRSGRGRTTQPGASRDEMRGLTDRELDPERESARESQRESSFRLASSSRASSSWLVNEPS